MLSLKPPVPTGDVEFQRVFRPGPDASIDDLTRLSSGRRALTKALLPLIVDQQPSPEALQTAMRAAEVYRKTWLAFWHTRIVRHASAPPNKRQTTTSVPVVFRWRVDVFHDETNAHQQRQGSIEYLDPSPLAETVCCTLALAVCRQRAGASTLGGPTAALNHFAAANELMQWTRTCALPLFRPWIRPRADNGTGKTSVNRVQDGRRREPHFFSAAFHEAIQLATTGQSLCKEALLQAVRGETAVKVSVRLFRGARRFQLASQLLPSELLLRNAHNRATASAYRYLSQGLAETTSYMGVAVACAREAVHLGEAAGPAAAAALTKHREYLAELERRNEAEAGWQRVPNRKRMRLAFSASVAALHVHEDEDAENETGTATSQHEVCITIPLQV